MTNFIKIEEAYKELSGSVFSYWIRLMMLRDHQLIGRSKLAAEIGVPLATSDRMLRELSLVGYVECVNNGAGKKTTVNLIKKAAIIGFNRFVRM